MYESYVLEWLKDEVKLRSNQYGGVKGVGTQHVLVQLYQELLENAEDYRAGTMVTSIDYSKAFNRMSFQNCLKALARNGASSQVLSLVAAFLTGRTMTVKVGDHLSTPREVHGGCPQGSILGVFCLTPRLTTWKKGARILNRNCQPQEELFTGRARSPRPRRGAGWTWLGWRRVQFGGRNEDAEDSITAAR